MVLAHGVVRGPQGPRDQPGSGPARTQMAHGEDAGVVVERVGPGHGQQRQRGKRQDPGHGRVEEQLPGCQLEPLPGAEPWHRPVAAAQAVEQAFAEDRMGGLHQPVGEGHRQRPGHQAGGPVGGPAHFRPEAQQHHDKQRTSRGIGQPTGGRQAAQEVAGFLEHGQGRRLLVAGRRHGVSRGGDSSIPCLRGSRTAWRARPALRDRR